MNSALSSSSFRFTTPSLIGVLVRPKTLSLTSSSSSSFNFISGKLFRCSNAIRACSLHVPHSSPKSLILHQLKTFTGAAVIIAAAFSLSVRSAKADPSPVALTEQSHPAETIEDDSSSSVNLLSFEALFENSLLMDQCGEGEAVIKQLEQALKTTYEEGNNAEVARDVRLVMAQVQFLQKNVEDALNIYQELSKEDPNDYKPYFCQGIILSLMDKNDEAQEQFAKYRELSTDKYDQFEAYLPLLTRMKLFGTEYTN